MQVIVEKVLPRIQRILEGSRVHDRLGRGAIEKRLMEGQGQTSPAKRTRLEQEVVEEEPEDVQELEPQEEQENGRQVNDIEEPIDSDEDPEDLDNATLSEDTKSDRAEEILVEVDVLNEEVEQEEAECDICQLSIPSASLQQHRKNHHNQENSQLPWERKQAECPICHKMLLKKSMTRHIRGCQVREMTTNRDEKQNEVVPYRRELLKCEECDKTIVRDGMSKHLQRHRQKEREDKMREKIRQMREEKEEKKRMDGVMVKQEMREQEEEKEQDQDEEKAEREDDQEQEEDELEPEKNDQEQEDDKKEQENEEKEQEEEDREQEYEEREQEEEKQDRMQDVKGTSTDPEEGAREESAEETQSERSVDSQQQVEERFEDRKWECYKCHKVMMHHSKNRHIRRHEDDERDGGGNRFFVKEEPSVNTSDFLAPSDDYNIKQWECPICMKTILHHSKTRHTRRHHMRGEGLESRQIITDIIENRVVSRVDKEAAAAEGIKEKANETKEPAMSPDGTPKWTCPVCQMSMHRNSKQRHIRDVCQSHVSEESNDSFTDVKTEADIDEINDMNTEMHQLEDDIEDESSKDENDEKDSIRTDPYKTNEEGRLNCDVCNVQVAMCSLSKHMQRKHPNQFMCKICSKNFNKLEGLKFHSKRSHGLKEDNISDTRQEVPPKKEGIKCDECDKVIMRDGMRKHIVRHRQAEKEREKWERSIALRMDQTEKKKAQIMKLEIEAKAKEIREAEAFISTAEKDEENQLTQEIDDAIASVNSSS